MRKFVMRPSIFDIDILDNVYKPELQEGIHNINNIIGKTEITKNNSAKILGNRVNAKNIILDKNSNYVSEEDIVNIANI